MEQRIRWDAFLSWFLHCRLWFLRVTEKSGFSEQPLEGRCVFLLLEQAGGAEKGLCKQPVFFFKSHWTYCSCCASILEESMSQPRELLCTFVCRCVCILHQQSVFKNLNYTNQPLVSWRIMNQQGFFRKYWKKMTSLTDL